MAQMEKEKASPDDGRKHREREFDAGVTPDPRPERMRLVSGAERPDRPSGPLR